MQGCPERRARLAWPDPRAFRANLEPRAAKELWALEVSPERKETKAAGEPRDCRESRGLRDHQGSPGCLGCRG